MHKTLEVILREVSQSGWATTSGTIEEVSRAASLSGLRSAILSGGKHHRVLVPHTTTEAPPRSLSAVYGLEAQPLHTDGAHLPEPPDLVILHSDSVSATPTVVWCWKGRRAPWIPGHVDQGVFTVRGSRGSYLASARDVGRLRFDPVCMSPGDPQAKLTVKFFADERQRAHVHEWNEPNTLLFIDNRQSLHARNAVVEDPSTRAISRLTYNMALTS
ncbi:hypothetical protein B0I08_102179 [Glaciihabitans tibetensis]|uniref:TfdA family taurine catabolism dioxygenase TauD n=1 Tax=Glaciihabitans tibetensis TaxID=1266600 RepID=A0A2T0VH14_9MICO|nr:hypothetical protein B0I08_102179 [Glaciihabitans tibetensis]